MPISDQFNNITVDLHLFNYISMSTFTAFFLSVVSFFIMRRYYKKSGLFNPMNIFFGVWFANLAFYDFDRFLGYFFYHMTPNADKWLSYSLVSFFFGSVVILLISKKRALCQTPVPTSDLKQMWHITLPLFFLFIIAVAWKYLILIKHYDGVFCSLAEIRQDANSEKFKFPFFLYFLTLPAYFVTINLGILTVLKKSKIALLLGLITLALAYLNSTFVGMRGGFVNVFLLFITSIMTSLFATKQIKIRHYIFICLIAIILLFILSLSIYLRSFNSDCPVSEKMKILNTKKSSATLFNTTATAIPKNPKDSAVLEGHTNNPSVKFLSCPVSEKMKIPNTKTSSATLFNTTATAMPKNLKDSAVLEGHTNNPSVKFSSAFFYHSYIYFVGTLPAYSYFLEHPWESTYWGTWTFYGVYKALEPLTLKFSPSNNFAKNINVQTAYAPITNEGPFNSSNYLTYIFSDFGFWGLIFTPFLLGLIANFVFFRIIFHSREIVYFQFMSLIFTGLILSIRGLITNGVYFWVLMCLFIFQYYYVSWYKSK